MPNGNTVKHGWILLLFVPLYITKRSEAVLQWGEKKKYQKRVYRESKLWRNYREKNAASCYINFQVIY